MPTLPPLIVDPCPDARGFWTIRLADGTDHGDTEHCPIATVYREDWAAELAAAPKLAAALRELHDATYHLKADERFVAASKAARAALAEAGLTPAD